MAKRALKVCSQPGCAELTDSGRCGECGAEAEKRRGTARQRGYGKAHHRFRQGVLAKYPVCVLCYTQPSTVADHYPLDRRELVAQGLDPNDPVNGRGLCASCHNKYTAEAQPGGWHAS